MRINTSKVSVFLVIFALGLNAIAMNGMNAAIPEVSGEQDGSDLGLSPLITAESEVESPSIAVPNTADAGIPPYLVVNAELNPTTIYVENTASPDSAQVTITLTGLGDPIVGRTSLDVVLAIDSSGSMDWNDQSGIRKSAAINFVNTLNMALDRVGVLSWDDNVDSRLEITNNVGAITSAINAIDSSGGTNLNVGLSNSISMLDARARPGTARVIIFLTDGEGTYSHTYAQSAASKGYVIYAIGLGNSVQESIMRDMATTTGGKYFKATNAASLIPIFQEIAIKVSSIAGTQIYVTEILANNIHYVAGSASIAPTTIEGQGLLWTVATLSINETWSVTFSIKASERGLWSVALYPDSRVAYKDYNQNVVTLLIPELLIQVITPNTPPIAVIGGPYAGDEGSVITFDASGSYDLEADTLQYRWDFNNDGIWDTPYSLDPTAINIWPDDYSGIVVVEVNDGEYASTNTTSITVANVAPMVSLAEIVGPQIMLSAIGFTGRALDPGTDDVTFTWDWGDGTTSTTLFPNLGTPVDVIDTETHTYAAPGNYIVTLTVTDDDGGSGVATTQVTVWGARDLKANAIALLQSLEPEHDCSDHHHDKCCHHHEAFCCHHDECCGRHHRCSNPPLHAIIHKIQCSLDEHLWLNATHLSPKWGQKVFDYEMCAAVLMEEQIRHNTHEIPHIECMIAKLEAKGCDAEHLKAELAYRQQVNAVYEQVLQSLVKADELLATVAIADAQAIIVANPRIQNVVDHVLAKANKDLNFALNLAADGHYSCAIHFYKRAWQHAMCAIKIATAEHHGCEHPGCEHHHDDEIPVPTPM